MSDWNDSKPIYLQLRQTVVQHITRGTLAEGEAVPSVRQVAADEKINPLTVSKAYQMLVDENLLEKRRGLGMLCLHVDRHWLKYADSLSIYPKFLDLVLADETTKVILPRNLVSWLKDSKFALAQVNF